MIDYENFRRLYIQKNGRRDSEDRIVLLWNQYQEQFDKTGISAELFLGIRDNPRKSFYVHGSFNNIAFGEYFRSEQEARDFIDRKLKEGQLDYTLFKLGHLASPVHIQLDPNHYTVLDTNAPYYMKQNPKKSVYRESTSIQPKMTISEFGNYDNEVIEDNLKMIVRDLKDGEVLEVNHLLFRFRTDEVIYQSQKIPCYKFYPISVINKETGLFSQDMMPRYFGFLFDGISRVFKLTERQEMSMFLDENLKTNPRKSSQFREFRTREFPPGQTRSGVKAIYGIRKGAPKLNPIGDLIAIHARRGDETVEYSIVQKDRRFYEVMLNTKVINHADSLINAKMLARYSMRKMKYEPIDAWQPVSLNKNPGRSGFHNLSRTGHKENDDEIYARLEPLDNQILREIDKYTGKIIKGWEFGGFNDPNMDTLVWSRGDYDLMATPYQDTYSHDLSIAVEISRGGTRIPLSAAYASFGHYVTEILCGRGMPPEKYFQIFAEYIVGLERAYKIKP